MSEQNSLPKHWEVKKLEELLESYIGGDWGKDENYEDENYSLAYCIRGSEIKKWDENKGKTASLRKIKKTNIEKRKLQVGDILVEISGGGPEQPVGRTVLIDLSVLSFQPNVPKICTNFLRLMRPLESIDSKFLNLYLTLFYCSGEIVKYQAGSNNLRNLKFPDYLKIDIPIPPLSEQQAIVSKIEELLSELENGKQQLLNAQQQLKVYRQSLLKWAFEGKLTHPDVKEGELPEGWKWVKITDLVENNKHALKAGPFGSSLKKEFYVETGYKIYGQEQVIIDNAFFGDYYIDEAKYQELKTCRIKPFDILISLVGTVGKVLILPENCMEGVINPRLIKISLNRLVYLPKFFKYYFESSSVKSHYKSEAQGTTMDVLNLGIIKKIPFPLTSIEEQQQIISELESKLTVCDKIEETISQGLQQAESLRQSILKMAFEGRLV
jgi:type I restriction enzyme S subunit